MVCLSRRRSLSSAACTKPIAMDSDERASLECYKAVSFGPPCVMVPHDARVCARIGKECVKEHFVIDVAGQVPNENLEL